VNASERLFQKLLLGDPFEENPFDENGWELFSKGIMCAGCGPAFYLHVKDIPFLPEQIRKKTKATYEDALLFKDYAVCCLKELQPALCRSGRVVILKGLALCETIYREPSIRPMGDVDLYFPDGSIEEARQVFLNNGYACLDTYRTVLYRGELHIDLHEDLWDARRILRRNRCVPDTTEIFEPSRLVPGFYIPCPSLLAVHSAYHAIKHCFSRKVWYLDLVLLHKAGYFKEPIAGPNAGMALIALDHCRRIGLVRDSFAMPPIPFYKRTLLHTLFTMKESPGTGEFALALSLPDLRGSLAYIVESLIPRKEILIEMYGNHAFIFLLVRRLFVLTLYTFGILSWKKNK
jgi:hypothetical protein